MSRRKTLRIREELLEPSSFNAHLIEVIMDICVKELISSAYWEGCRNTLILVRDKWKAASPVFEYTYAVSPPNPNPVIFPVLSREWLEAKEYQILNSYICCFVKCNSK